MTRKEFVEFLVTVSLRAIVFSALFGLALAFTYLAAWLTKGLGTKSDFYRRALSRRRKRPWYRARD